MLPSIRELRKIYGERYMLDKILKKHTQLKRNHAKLQEIILSWCEANNVNRKSQSQLSSEIELCIDDIFQDLLKLSLDLQRKNESLEKSNAKLIQRDDTFRSIFKSIVNFSWMLDEKNTAHPMKEESQFDEMHEEQDVKMYSEAKEDMAYPAKSTYPEVN